MVRSVGLPLTRVGSMFAASDAAAPVVLARWPEDSPRALLVAGVALGAVAMANAGPNTNGSQFFITTGPCEWMNHNYVGVGRLLQGFSVLRTLNQLATSNQRPVKNITVANCGVTPLV